MTENLERAKQIMQTKILCFMQWHADKIKEMGGEIMEEEDLTFLLSLEGTANGEVFYTEESFEDDAQRIFNALEDAKSKGFKGISLMAERSYIGEKDQAKLQEKGYFVKYIDYGSASWQEVYFSEEDYIKAQIASYKHQFGCFASVASMI
jgi:hypothetical protein